MRAIYVEPDQQHNLLSEKENEFVQHMIPIYREQIRDSIRTVEKYIDTATPLLAQQYRRMIELFERQIADAEALYLKLQGGEDDE